MMITKAIATTGTISTALSALLAAGVLPSTALAFEVGEWKSPLSSVVDGNPWLLRDNGSPSQRTSPAFPSLAKGMSPLDAVMTPSWAAAATAPSSTWADNAFFTTAATSRSPRVDPGRSWMQIGGERLAMAASAIPNAASSATSAALESLGRTWYNEYNPTARRTVYDDAPLEYNFVRLSDDWPTPGSTLGSYYGSDSMYYNVADDRSPPAQVSSGTSTRRRGPFRRAVFWARRRLSRRIE